MLIAMVSILGHILFCVYVWYRYIINFDQSCLTLLLAQLIVILVVAGSHEDGTGHNRQSVSNALEAVRTTTAKFSATRFCNYVYVLVQVSIYLD